MAKEINNLKREREEGSEPVATKSVDSFGKET